MESIISLFNETMAEYGEGEIFKSMHEHAKFSPEFPTPADIIERMEMDRMAVRIANEQRKTAETLMIETSKPEYIEKLRRYKEKGIPLSPEQQEALARATS